MSEGDTADASGSRGSSPQIGGGLSLTPTSDPGWLIFDDASTLEREHEIESLFAIANGYVGARAALEEGGPLSQAGSFVAGVYNDKDSALGPTLAVLPDWAHLEIAVNGQLLKLEAGQPLEHRRILDLRQGLMWREWVHQDPSGGVTRIRFLRLASLCDRHALFHATAVTAENYSGRVEFLAALPSEPDAPETAHGPTPCDPAPIIIAAGEGYVALAFGTLPSRTPQDEARRGAELVADCGEMRWAWEVSIGETIGLDRFFAVFASRRQEQAAAGAELHLAHMLGQGAAQVLNAHIQAWSRRWSVSDVQIVGDDEAQKALRFAIYHLTAAADPGNERASIGARGLTGEAYRGHVFWDTEIYMLPFYLLTNPAAARALLMHRYHTLDAAREKAKAHGYRGALYAWESADTGEEATPAEVLAPDGQVIRILTGEQEHHVSADIAYAVWRYWRATGDDDFMVAAGAAILVETARFWASRAHIDKDGHAHIRAVIGPDEYHETVDDDAYTNVMARWNLHRAVDAVCILKRNHPAGWGEQSRRLGLGNDEPDEWRRVAAALVTGYHAETKLFEQFEGYFGLQEVDVGSHRNGETPFDLWLGQQRLRQSKAVKQADVVLLCALLWEEWPKDVHRANFTFYEPRTAHGSSLSPAIHALVSARLGDKELALSYFQQASEIDLANNMGNAAGGVHMAALGGLWQAAIFGLAGLRLREEGVALDPNLPPDWQEMHFCAHWRRAVARFSIYVQPPRIVAEIDGDGEMTLAIVDGPSHHAHSGRRYWIERDDSTWGEWREAER